jgi:uncharacterized protein (TIGR00251 family)
VQAAVIIRVKVKPNARAARLVRQPDASWSAAVKSPAHEGRANAELIALIAGHFGCRKSAVSIKSGHSGRIKLIEIASANTAEKHS